MCPCTSRQKTLISPGHERLDAFLLSLEAEVWIDAFQNNSNRLPEIFNFFAKQQRCYRSSSSWQSLSLLLYQPWMGRRRLVCWEGGRWRGRQRQSHLQPGAAWGLCIHRHHLHHRRIGTEAAIYSRPAPQYCQQDVKPLQRLLRRRAIRSYEFHWTALYCNFTTDLFE